MTNLQTKACFFHSTNKNCGNSVYNLTLRPVGPWKARHRYARRGVSSTIISGIKIDDAASERPVVFTVSVGDFLEGGCGSLTRRFDGSPTAVLVEGHVRVGTSAPTGPFVRAAYETRASGRASGPSRPPSSLSTGRRCRGLRLPLMDSYVTDSTWSHLTWIPIKMSRQLLMYLRFLPSSC